MGRPDVLRRRRGRASGSGRRRDPRQDPCHDRHPHGLPHPRGEAVRLARLRRTASAEAEDPRHRIRGQVEAVGAAVTEFAGGDEVFGGSPVRFGAHAEYVCVREARRPGAQAGRHELRARRPAVCDGFVQAASALRTAELRAGPAHRRLRRLRIAGDGGRAAGEAPRRPRDGGVRHEERRPHPLPRRRRGRRLPAAQTTRRTARRTTSSSTPSDSISSPSAGARSGPAGSSSRPSSAG